MKTKPTITELLDCQYIKDIKALMEKYGIKGKTGDTSQCVISNYLKAVTGLPKVRTTRYYCYDSDDAKIILQATPALTDFIDAFDSSKFLELVA